MAPAGMVRSPGPAAAVRPAARRIAPPTSTISPATSLLAASFANLGPPLRDEGVPDHAPPTAASVVARRATSGAESPVGRRAGQVHWTTWAGAPALGSLLDLQRLAGNAAVVSALGRGPEAGPGRPGRGDSEDVQRINIPGIGEVNVSGYLNRATSLLSSSEKTRDEGKADARKGAEDAAGEATEQVDSGQAELETGKAEAEGAGDAIFSESSASAEAAASGGRESTAAGKATGDQVAEKVSAVASEVEGLTDPLADATGSPAGAAGEHVIAEAAGHAAGAGGGPETAAPAVAEPAVSHGPGPPAPAHGPPAPGAAAAPAGAGPSPAAAPAPPIPAPAGPAGAGGPGPSAPSAAGPIQMVGPAGPSCALAEAARTIKGYRDKAADFARGVAGRVAAIEIPLLGVTVGDLAKKASAAAAAVGKKLRKVKDAVVAKVKATAEKVKRGIAQATKVAKKAFDAAATGVKKAVNLAKDAVVKGWNAAKTAVANAVTKAKEKAASAVRGAISTVQGWIRSIPGAVLDLLGATGTRLRAFASARDPLGDAAAYLAEKKRQGQEALERAKQKAINAAKRVADLGVRKAAELYRDARAKASAVADAARTAAPYVAAVVAPGVVVAAALAQKAADTWGDDIRAGADAVKKKLKGEACEALSDTVGPCIDMYLPKPENNDKAFARLSGQADITVPLHEVDVPCNVKMGHSASVAVERTSTGYGVSVDGEALVFANLAAGKEGVKEEVKVEMPTGGMATVWEKLGGGAKPPVPGAGPGAPTPGGTPGTPAAAPAPGAPATAPGAPAPGPQGGGGGAEASGEIEAGVKGSASLKFAFPTGTNTCDGAGGVAALLGALGVSAALPSPLDMIAKSGVVGSWEGNLVSNTVTMAVAGGGQAEVSKEGLGALKGSGQAEAYVTAGVERGNEKDPGSLRPTLKVGAGLKGELAAELAVPKLGLAKGALSGAGKLESTLLYDRPGERIILQSVAAEAEVGLAVGGINPAVVAGLAPPFGPAAAAKIYSLGLAHNNGSIKAKVFGKADNLQKYIDAAGTYLGGDPSSVSAGGLVRALAGKYDQNDFSSGVTVTATLSDRMGVEGKVEEIAGEGAKAGVSAKASLEVGKEYQLYP